MNEESSAEYRRSCIGIGRYEDAVAGNIFVDKYLIQVLQLPESLLT